MRRQLQSLTDARSRRCRRTSAAFLCLLLFGLLIAGSKAAWTEKLREKPQFATAYRRIARNTRALALSSLSRFALAVYHRAREEPD